MVGSYSQRSLCSVPVVGDFQEPFDWYNPENSKAAFNAWPSNTSNHIRYHAFCNYPPKMYLSFAQGNKAGLFVPCITNWTL